MNERDFTLEGNLRLGAGGLGVERDVLDLTADNGLHVWMQPYDPSLTAGIDAHIAAIGAALGTEPSFPAGSNRRDRHEMRGVHHTTTKWNLAKIREAVGLAMLTGSLDEPDRLHVHDVCGGKGAVALYVEWLRGRLGRESTGTCWELRADQQPGHEWIRDWLGLASPLDFQASDVAHADLSRRPGGVTHALAKHACGRLTDAVFVNALARPVAERPHLTAVMTCCHSYLDGTEAFWPEELPLERRLELARRADPHRELDPYVRDVVGVACRRVIDTLRAKHLDGRVREALPFEKLCQRNQVLLKRG